MHTTSFFKGNTLQLVGLHVGVNILALTYSTYVEVALGKEF